MTWAEVIRRLKAAGFVEVRAGKGSHRLLKHPTTGKEVWVAVHTKKDADEIELRPLTDAERAELEVERRELIAKVKRRLSDKGIAGVPHHEFLTGWDGVQLKPPSFS